MEVKEVDEFSFIDLLFRIKKRIILVIAIILIATIIPLMAGVFLTKPVYESKVTILVEMPRQDENSSFADNTMYSNLMGTYIVIAKTNFVAEKAAAEIMDVTAGELSSSISVTNNSMILYITMVNKDPEIAYNGVIAYAKAFMTRGNELLPEGKLTIVDNSGKPTTPINSSDSTMVVAGFILGTMVAFVLAYILEELEIIKKNKNIKNI